MHILFLTPRLPYPPNRGDKVRPWNFAKALAAEHTLSLVSLIQAEEERGYAHQLSEVFEHVEMVLLKPWQSYRNMLLGACSLTPLQISYFHCAELEHRLELFLKRHPVDVAYMLSLRMAPYAASCDKTYTVLDLCDAISMFLERRLPHAPVHVRPILRLEQGRVRRYEREIAHRFDECWVISQIDLEAIWGEAYPGNAIVVPNGVDTDHFRPASRRPRTHTITFVGYMGAESVDAVTWFHKDIFPFIRQQVPEAQLCVVGANAPAKIRALAESRSVIVTGFVDDLPGCYDQAAVVIAPMRFVAGMQNKVLEAMAMEVPVVATSGANEGIDATNGREIFVADHPADFADKVIRLLSDGQLAQRMGAKARWFVRERFTWNHATRRMQNIDLTLQERRRTSEAPRPAQ
jgi:sugar transferase (PEP-CTERM/EpsH1 system associated)